MAAEEVLDVRERSVHEDHEVVDPAQQVAAYELLDVLQGVLHGRGRDDHAASSVVQTNPAVGTFS